MDTRNHTTRRREELEVIELPANWKNAKGAGRKKGTNKTRGSMESSHIHKRPVLLTFMAMAALPVSSMQRSNLRLRRVLQGKRERERERGTRACLRACTNPNPSPIVRSSDRTILSVPGLERFWETWRLTNYWPGSKWMLNLSSWMCLFHPWEHTGPFIIIRVFLGLFHFGDRDLAGQENTYPALAFTFRV